MGPTEEVPLTTEAPATLAEDTPPEPAPEPAPGEVPGGTPEPTRVPTPEPTPEATPDDDDSTAVPPESETVAEAVSRAVKSRKLQLNKIAGLLDQLDFQYGPDLVDSAIKGHQAKEVRHPGPVEE